MANCIKEGEIKMNKMDENPNYGNYIAPTFLNSTAKIVIFTAVLYFIIARLSLLLIVPEINFPAIFPQIGFGVGFILIFGRKALLGVIIGSLASSLTLYLTGFDDGTTIADELASPLVFCVARSLVAILNIYIVSYLTQLWCKKRCVFNRASNVLYFGLAALLGSFISLTLFMFPIFISSSVPIDKIMLIWSNWSRSNTLGIMLITPLILSWFCKTNEVSRWTLSKKIEGGLLIILTVGISFYIFTTPANNESIIFFVLIWAASGFGMRTITLLALIVTIIAIYCTKNYLGGFVSNDWNSNFFMLQLFIFVNMTSILYLKTIMDEKTSRGNELKISEQSLNLKNTILQATIESPKGISFFSLDTNLNYLSFNSAHAEYMKKEYDVDIEIGQNHIEFITTANRKEEINSIFQSVLKGNIYYNEEKDAEGEYWSVHKSPIKNQKGSIIGTTTIITNITELKLKEIQLEKNNIDLNERFRELDCLYTISETFHNKALTKLEKLEACVQIIPNGMQFPQIANCKIQIKENEFLSVNYHKSKWFLRQLIIINGEEIGSIEVGYFDTNRDIKENPFINEEVKLFGAVTKIIAKALESNSAEEKIKQSEEEFRTIFDSFEDVYIRASLDGHIQNVSPSVEKILKHKREEIINTSVANLYLNSADRAKVLQVLNENGYINDFETIFKDKENNPVYVSINAHFVYNSQGEAIYSEGTIRDINQRKKNELEIEMANELIRENEKKYRTIFESVRDVFFRASAKDHTILDISPSCAYFDLEPSDIIGKTIESFYQNPDDRQAVIKELRQKGEIKNYDVKFLLNNKTYTVSINSKIVFDENNEPEFFIGSFRDVSDRIEAEEKLKESEAKFRSIYENFEDIYFRTGLDGTMLDLSPSFERNFKMKRSDVIGTSTSFTYCNPEDRETMAVLLKENRRIIDFDTRFIDGEGGIVAISVNVRTLFDSNGDPLYLEGTMRNINERSIFQEEMLAKNRTLEFQNTELEQFAYIASHDLQEPLITIIQCIELLQEGLDENLIEEKKQYLEFINSSTSRMQQLVKGLLDYSRIGKERKNSRIDCNEVVADVLADMNVSLKESNAIVEYEILPVIEGYITEMRQLFQNIISNANKYRKKGRQPKIKISAVKEENNWVFSIEDNGIGIKGEDMEKVFVIFKRLHNRDEYHGTGIGLSHCKKIVEHHNGKIWVESKYNVGSTFKWTIPVESN
jgi:PAS domain S-box-containing protein